MLKAISFFDTGCFFSKKPFVRLYEQVLKQTPKALKNKITVEFFKISDVLACFA